MMDSKCIIYDKIFLNVLSQEKIKLLVVFVEILNLLDYYSKVKQSNPIFYLFNRFAAQGR